MSRAGLAVVLALVAPWLTGCPVEPRVFSATGTVTTVIVVRHAERDPGLDPPLLPEGEARAAALATVLADSPVDVIYATNLIRNRQTAEPLAAQSGAAVVLVDPLRYANPAATAAELIDEWLRLYSGGTIVFIGNIGSVFGTDGINEQLYLQLGGTGELPTRYQDLTVAVIPEEGATRVIAGRYGARSSLDP